MAIQIIPSPLGPLKLRSGGDALLSISFLDNESETVDGTSDSITELAAVQLSEYFREKRKTFDIPLLPAGTDFQKAVWTIVKNIPLGETLSYKTISEQLNNTGAIRAVGAANGQNPLPIIIPCHRVIGSDGKLTGYAGGLWRKHWLLDHEHKISRRGQQALFFEE